jgi:hypothetical protein
MFFVMAGLDPAIHHSSKEPCLKMDCRVKPGNDGGAAIARSNGTYSRWT